MNDDKPYFGSERRREQRRKSQDRRELIRFELNAEPRRRGYGRRKGEIRDSWGQQGDRS